LRPDSKAWNFVRDDSSSVYAFIAERVRYLVMHRSSASLRVSDVFLLAKSVRGAEHRNLHDPIKGRAPNEENGEWDKTLEVPAVHGALHWWALSKAVKPRFLKQYWREQERSRALAASMPVLR
jgi:hypothetical protein